MTSPDQAQPQSAQPQSHTSVNIPAMYTLTESVNNLAKETRRSNKFSMLKGTVLFGFAAAYAVGAFFFFGGAPQAPGQEYVAVVKIQGMIADGTEASYAALAPALKEAFEDEASKGVILHVNSPGGTPVQSSLIHDLILDLKQTHKKPVIAVGEDLVTSGAYFISVAADEIYVNRSTVAGSIGVISAGFGFTDLMGKLGVERRVTTAGTSKNNNDPFLTQKPEDQEMHKELLSNIHAHFKDEVTSGRGDRLKVDTPGLFEGKVWTGAAAKELGLVDGLGSITKIAESKFGVSHFKYYNKKKSVESILADMGVSTVQAVLPELQSATKSLPQVVY